MGLVRVPVMKWQDALCILKAIAHWHLRYCSGRKICCSEWAIYYSIQHFSHFPSNYPHILRYDHDSIAFHLFIIRNRACRKSKRDIWTLLMSKTFCWDQGFTSIGCWPATLFDQQVPDAHIRSVPYQVHTSSRVLPPGHTLRVHPCGDQEASQQAPLLWVAQAGSGLRPDEG